MTCLLCSKTITPENFLSPRQCAFKDGSFGSDNWQCESMLRLRAVGEEVRQYCEDHSATLISVCDPADEILFVMMQWYKNRGRTDVCFVYDGTVWRVPTATEIDRLVEALDG